MFYKIRDYIRKHFIGYRPTDMPCIDYLESKGVEKMKDKEIEIYVNGEKVELFDYEPLKQGEYFYKENDKWYVHKLKNVSFVMEKDKKIEKLDHLIGYDIRQFEDLREYIEITTNDLFGKTNKIIDKINEIIDCINKEE